jgi:cell wall-associated NlpC family hydrolase
MNVRTSALGLGGFVLLLLAVIPLLGGGASSSVKDIGHVTGGTDLNDDAVPDWARGPLRASATTCPEITAPLLAAQIETESNWNPNAHNDESGADGLTQFIPPTWQQYGTDGDGDGRADPRNPSDAIRTQAAYMCYLVNWVKGRPGLSGELVDLALAAYNAGPGNVSKFNGVPPFVETTHYVTAIRNLANTKYSRAPVAPPAAGEGRSGPVIQRAAEQAARKTPYAWGGGTLDGPSGGSAPDVGVIGFDCSSLVRYAYYQGTVQQITLPRTSQAQYDATKGQSVAIDALQPGDLLFWGGAGSIHHVALYIGNNRMIEAPQSGQVIHETDIRTNGDFRSATRVFGGPLDDDDVRDQT